MKNPVIAIGLDAVSPELLESWISEGHLENLRRLRDQGTRTYLDNFDYYRAETPWTTFLTGCSPQKTGYWSPIRFHQDTYTATLVESYDYQECPPFYALGDRHRVAVFDMPHVRIVDEVDGIQVTAWGAHSPQGPSESKPKELFQELVERHGVHPGLHNDHANCFDLAALEHLEQVLTTGIARRADICCDLLNRDNWDLFLTVFGETHAAGHFMWHLSQTDHPLYESIGAAAGDRMLSVFKAVDEAVGRIAAAAPQDAYIVVFSAHGMGSNVMDLPSGTFLPEFMYRYCFPGSAGLAKGNAQTTVGDPIIHCKKNSWSWEVWSTKDDANPVRRFLRREAPYRVFKKIEPFLGKTKAVDLISPHKMKDQRNPLGFQPSAWYMPCWRQMKAFALPSFSEGYIRINLKGREADGLVDPSDYHAVCDDITQKLYRMVDARTGVPMVSKVIRTRQSPLDTDPKLPDADLVIVWQEQHATDTVDSPDFGRIGPVPHLRTGSHRSQGFLMAKGAGIEPNSQISSGHALDLAPTLLHLMGAPIPEHLEGRPLLETNVPVLQ